MLLAGRQKDASDYFLGRRGLPWWAIMLSIVATETSALTVISVPGIAATGNLTFIQLSFGYLIGRIGVAALLLHGYFDGTQETAYQRLERRFGLTPGASPPHVPHPRSGTAWVFATAIPLAIITGGDAPGISPGLATIFTPGSAACGGGGWIIQLLSPAGRRGDAGRGAAPGGRGRRPPSAYDHFKLSSGPRPLVSRAHPYAVRYGGALLGRPHGPTTTVQRLLAAPTPDARKALIGSGVFVIFQFALFAVGTSLGSPGRAAERRATGST
jgi:hypothetical protein